VAAGDEVYVVIVSRGAPDVFPHELIEQGRQEAAAANNLLGVKRLYFLDFPAPRLDGVPTSTLSGAIKGVIDQLQPSTVYLPHQGDIHGDHKAVYWATLVACRPKGELFPARLLCYETPSETEWGAPISCDAFVPTVFVDVSKYLGAKLEAMKCYQSQLAPSTKARSLSSIGALANYRGSTIGVLAAEAFSLVREVIL
jgi:LmbE family N-acetylglucosaminyl deacetylase